MHEREGVRVVEYRLPDWHASTRGSTQRVAGFLEAILTFNALMWLGLRELYRERHAIVYVPTSEIPWVTATGYVLSKALRRRFVLVNLSARPEVAKMVGGWVGRVLWFIHKKADVVIAVSMATAEELRVVGVKGNVSVNSSGFTRSILQPNNDQPQRQGATYVGRLEVPKGMYDLLETWSQVTTLFPLANLQVVGYATPDNRSAFLRRRNELGLDTNVKVVGVLTDRDKWDLLEKSRICLFLSHAEGWGYVPLEALSLGVPAVVYDLPCYRESLEGLEGVFRVPDGNASAAAEQVIRLLQMDERSYRELSRSIKATFHHPDWKPVASEEVALIYGIEPDPGDLGSSSGGLGKSIEAHES
jgi:glycosyltransferase involved in cell wall biosynthesis